MSIEVVRQGKGNVAAEPVADVAATPVAESAPAPAAKRTQIIVHVESVSIGDMMAMDEMFSSKPGAFADGIRCISKFVTNMTLEELQTLEVPVLRSLVPMVMQAIQEAAAPKN